MLRRITITGLVCAAAFLFSVSAPRSEAKAAGRGQPTDWQRFYYYPYVYYPQNFQRNQGSFDHLYYRYPPSRRIPVYNKNWFNFYPSKRPYHKGNHFMLDVF